VEAQRLRCVYVDAVSAAMQVTYQGRQQEICLEQLQEQLRAEGCSEQQHQEGGSGEEHSKECSELQSNQQPKLF